MPASLFLFPVSFFSLEIFLALFLVYRAWYRVTGHVRIGPGTVPDLSRDREFLFTSIISDMSQKHSERTQGMDEVNTKYCVLFVEGFGEGMKELAGEVANRNKSANFVLYTLP